MYKVFQPVKYDCEKRRNRARLKMAFNSAFMLVLIEEYSVGEINCPKPQKTPTPTILMSAVISHWSLLVFL